MTRGVVSPCLTFNSGGETREKRVKSTLSHWSHLSHLTLGCREKEEGGGVGETAAPQAHFSSCANYFF